MPATNPTLIADVVPDDREFPPSTFSQAELTVSNSRRVPERAVGRLPGGSGLDQGLWSWTASRCVILIFPQPSVGLSRLGGYFIIPREVEEARVGFGLGTRPA